MNRVKFGFKTFISIKHPIPRLSTPFDKATGLKKTTSGLWCYVTSRGVVSKRPTYSKTLVIFEYYYGDSKAHVYLPEFHRYTTISLDSIHTKDEEHPIAF